jgi:hypothetical protein
LGLEDLDAKLGGGLAWGTISEWGIPFGCGGREIMVSCLAKLTAGTDPAWCLWVYARKHCQVYPPAWHGRGVNLRWLRFAQTQRPVKDLKPLFLDPTFKLIVLDQPVYLSDEDIVFLNQQARAHKKHVMILRDYLLASGSGAGLARYRINCWRMVQNPCLQVEGLRGLRPGVLKLGNWQE